MYGDFGTTMSKALNLDPNFVFGNVVAKCYDMFGELHYIKTLFGLISDLDLRYPVFIERVRLKHPLKTSS